MTGRYWGKHLGPALLFGVLALFCLLPVAAGQSLKDLPPPPPPLPTPKPTPPPEPKDEDFDVVKVTNHGISPTLTEYAIARNAAS